MLGRGCWDGDVGPGRRGSGGGLAGSQFVDHLHQGLHILVRNIGGHAVPQIEDMPGASFGRQQHIIGPAADGGQVGIQGDGVEVPLHTAGGADGGPAGLEVDPPVETNHIAAGIAAKGGAGRGCR